MEDNKSSLGLDQNIAAGLSYLFGWVTGLIIYLLEKDNKFVKFHALQSIITFLIINVVTVVLGGLAKIPFIGVIFGILSGIVGIIGVILYIFGIVFAFKNQIIKFPIIGEIAQSIVEKN